MVIFSMGESRRSVFEGFTLVGGRGGGGWHFSSRGGGILCLGSSPTIRGCTIRDFEASLGGGIYIGDDSQALISSCIISGNYGFLGGGIACGEKCSARIEGCTVDHNENSGIRILRGDPGDDAPRLEIDSTRIFHNRADCDNGGGGGICVENGIARIVNCAIYKNEGWAAGFGGAIEVDQAIVEIVCSTLAGNRADGAAGGIFLYGGTLRLIDTILWGNGDNLLVSSPDTNPSSVEVSFSVIGGETDLAGLGAIDADPLFADPMILDYDSESGDISLAPGSPAIDAGTSVDAPEDDLEGRPRPCGAGVDIGAYEYGDCVSPGCGDPNGDEDHDGVTNAFEDLDGDGVCATDDTDGDGIPNILDPDDDGDGVPTADELIYGDTDDDGIPNYLDDDDDADGIPSRLEDLNGNGNPSDDDGNSDGRPAYLDPTETTAPGRFKRGDSNADSTTDISDAIGILSFLFTGGKAPSCQKAADVTDDGTVDISDGVALLSHLFLGGKAPPEPFAAFGIDPTVDELTCEGFGPCG
jgi:hypothetical protein